MANDARQEGEPPVAGAPEVRRTVLAIVLGWLFPGLGHVVLKRYRRGVVFALLILTSFTLGMTHDGTLALWDARQPFLSSLQVVANLGVGPADTVARWSVYGEAAYLLPSVPSDPAAISRSKHLRERARSSISLYGTAYLWTAGLMNLLLLFELWDFGTGRKR